MRVIAAFLIAAFLIALTLAITCMCVLFGGQPSADALPYKDALVVSLMIAYLNALKQPGHSAYAAAP